MAGPHEELEDASIAGLQAQMGKGELTALALVRAYRARIESLDAKGPSVNSVLELNPEAEEIASAFDEERRAGRVRGPLHGIPILLKGNVDTADAMATSAGSLALLGVAPARDATVAARLRGAGAVLLGKTNLSEWANFRSTRSSSGWSAHGGQTRNPYVLDRNPCGSSSGSAVAVSAAFCAAALGTETDGSIVCPSHQNGVVGIKPTVGLTSRAGVVPISRSQDTVGPHAKTVADAAAVLGALTGVDPRDPATAAAAGSSFADYTRFLDPVTGLEGKRIGVTRAGVTGYSPETDALYEDALDVLRSGGAILVDPADLATMEEVNAGTDELVVLAHEFKRYLNAYLATRPGLPVQTLADLIEFNEAHAEQELRWFGQELFELAESDPYTSAQYEASLANARALGGARGIDATLAADGLDVLVAPTGGPAWPTDLVNGDHFLGGSSSAAAIAGYPIVNVPMGHAFGLPLGLSFFGAAWSEPELIAVASAFEAAAQARRKPQFLPALPLDAACRASQGEGPEERSTSAPAAPAVTGL